MVFGLQQVRTECLRKQQCTCLKSHTTLLLGKFSWHIRLMHQISISTFDASNCAWWSDASLDSKVTINTSSRRFNNPFSAERCYRGSAMGLDTNDGGSPMYENKIGSCDGNVIGGDRHVYTWKHVVHPASTRSPPRLPSPATYSTLTYPALTHRTQPMPSQPNPILQKLANSFVKGADGHQR